MKPRSLIVLAVIFSSLLLTDFAFARKWTDRSGKHSIEAEFVALKKNLQVRLRRQDGTFVEISLDKLSVPDQNHARKAAASKSASPFVDPGGDSPAFPPESKTLKADTNTQMVTAQGVGTSPREALEDAFREAVRQVVGLVVDAKTLVKNDELIEDKVLTYSDGFVKGYKKLSETRRKGLVRIKITAVVERRSVVMKLKAANITVKRLKGKGLFAKALTDLEAKKNTAALLTKALVEFPTLVTAKQVGKPTFDQAASEIVIDVLLKVDAKAYTSHQKRLEEVLAKICLDKSSVLIKAGPVDNSNPPLKRGINPDFRTTQWGGYSEKIVRAKAAIPLVGPLLSGKTKNGWTVWVNSSRNATHTSTRWNGYVVVADVAESIRALTGQIMINVALLDAGGELVTEDEFEWVTMPDLTYKDGTYAIGGWNCHLPLIRMAMIRHKTTGSPWPMSWSKPSLGQIVFGHLKALERNSFQKDYAVNLYIAPYSFTVKPSGYGGIQLNYQSQLVLQRRIKATLDELKQIQSVQCEAQWHPDTKRDPAASR